MASILRYDTQVMRTQADKFEKTAAKMAQVKKDLNTSIDKLVSEYWQSDAGTAFENTYSSDWGNNVDQYIAVMNEFAKMLRKAASEYDEVTKVAEKVSVN
jgi:WXG100 family type VII secretion target